MACFKAPKTQCGTGLTRNTAAITAAYRGDKGSETGLQGCVAEGGGFEPPIRFPVYTLSRRAPSTTRPPLRRRPMFAGRAGNILESNENARLQTRVREINASIHPPAIAYRKL